jgi:hypothetical protein
MALRAYPVLVHNDIAEHEADRLLIAASKHVSGWMGKAWNECRSSEVAIAPVLASMCGHTRSRLQTLGCGRLPTQRQRTRAIASETHARRIV